MTRTQLLKALDTNGIEFIEITGRGRTLGVILPNVEAAEDFCNKIADWDGCTNQAGAVWLRAGYTPRTDAEHHY